MKFVILFLGVCLFDFGERKDDIKLMNELKVLRSYFDQREPKCELIEIHYFNRRQIYQLS